MTEHQNISGYGIVQCQRFHSIWYICSQHNNRFSVYDFDHTQVSLPPPSPNSVGTYFVDKMNNHGYGICGIITNAFAQTLHCDTKSS